MSKCPHGRRPADCCNMLLVGSYTLEREPVAPLKRYPPESEEAPQVLDGSLVLLIVLAVFVAAFAFIVYGLPALD